MSERPHTFFLFPSGNCFPVADPVAFCLENARHPLLYPARERLLLSDARTDPDRVLNVVLRRCGLNMAVVSPGRVVVHHWTQLADLRPFFKEHRLASPEVQAALVRRKSGLVTIQPGDDFLYGERLGEAFPWAEYQGRWEGRHEKQADDRAAAPRGWCHYRWAGVVEGRIPWGSLLCIWRREKPHDCPNCNTPLAVWSFDYQRSGLFNMYGHVLRCCFHCLRSFEERAGDLWPWLLSLLAPDLLPAWHDDGLRKTDLRPRWPAPAARNLHDLNDLPRDLTLDELVRILM